MQGRSTLSTKPRTKASNSAVMCVQPAELSRSEPLSRSQGFIRGREDLAPDQRKPHSRRTIPNDRRPVQRIFVGNRGLPLTNPPRGGGRSRRGHRRSSRPLIITTGNRRSLATPYFQRLATSVFMNRKPSAASCRSLWYILRQIFVAGTIFSRASPNASITIAPS